MDSLEFQSALRDLDLFLSRGAALVPEPVFERDMRRHVDAVGNRTALESPDESDVLEQGPVVMRAEINFLKRSVVVLRGGPKPTEHA